MKFNPENFDPPEPAPRPLQRRPWTPPLWDRPSEGCLGAVVPVERVLGQSDEATLVLDQLRVFPHGFVIELIVL
jgi:hypothetical protein